MEKTEREKKYWGPKKIKLNRDRLCFSFFLLFFAKMKIDIIVF